MGEISGANLAIINNIILTIVTAVYATVTFFILRESRATRVSTIQSEISVDVYKHQRKYYLMVRNEGRRSALDVVITFDPPFHIKTEISNLPFGELTYRGLGPGQERSYFVDTTPGFWARKLPRVYTAHIAWICPVAGSQVRTHVVDMATFHNNTHPDDASN